MLMPVPDRAPALFRAGDLGVSAEWRDISYDWSPLLTPDGVAIYSYLRDTYDQQRNLYPFLLAPDGPTKKKIQTRLGLRSAYAMHGPEFLLTTVGLLHVEVMYGQGADPERPHHTHVAYYVVGRLDHPVLDWPMLERVLDALMIALQPAAVDSSAQRQQRKAEAALRALGQAGLLQNCDPHDLFYELGAWPNLLPTLIADQRWAALFTHLHGIPAMQHYRRQARMWAEYAQRYVARLEQDNQRIRQHVLAAQRAGSARRDIAASALSLGRAVTAAPIASSQLAVTEPVALTSAGSVTAESPVSHWPAALTSAGAVTAAEHRSKQAAEAPTTRAIVESLRRDRSINDRCRWGELDSTGDREAIRIASDRGIVGSASDSADDQLSDDLPLIEPHLRDQELVSYRFDAYFWCAVNTILGGSSARYDFSPGEKQTVFRQFKRQNIPVGVVLAALRASVERLAPAQRQTLADVLKTPLFHACLQRALALLPARAAPDLDAHDWPAFLTAYRRVGSAGELRDVSVPDYNVLKGLFLKQPAECWEVLSRIEHMAQPPALSPRYLQRAIVHNQRAAAEAALAGSAEAAPCRTGAHTGASAGGADPLARRNAEPGDRRRALLEREGLKPQLLTETMTDTFIEAWIAEADARRAEIKSRTRWLVWGLTSGVLPQDHPTLPLRAAGRTRQPSGHVQSVARPPSLAQPPDSVALLAEVWQTLCARLRAQGDDGILSAWLERVELYALVPASGTSTDAVAYLLGDYSSNLYRPGALAEQPPAVYSDLIVGALGAVCGCRVRLEYAATADDLPAGIARGVWLANRTPAVTKSTEQLWTQVLATLERQLPRLDFVTWLAETQLIALEDVQAIVGVANIFVREQIEARYAPTIANALQKAVGMPVAVQVVISGV